MIAHSASVRSCRPCILNLPLFGSLNHIGAEKKIPFPFMSTRPRTRLSATIRPPTEFRQNYMDQSRDIATAFLNSRKARRPQFLGSYEPN